LPNRFRRIAALPARLSPIILPLFCLLPFLLTAAQAPAQSATPVAHLDPNRLIGTYFTIARYPIKRQKHCVSDDMVLYALGDKKNSVQIVTSCQLKGTNVDSWNASGKFSPAGTGQIKLSAIWPFTTKYWILAVAPDYSWVLAGTPNHKSLWILSRSYTLPPDINASIEAKATAQGFDTAKLIHITQYPRPPAEPVKTNQPSSTPAVANPPAKPPSF
jgi:apolipoprotein D and lipocalin family protein